MKKLYLYPVVFLALTAVSCNKFDEYNTNPDKNTVVTPELLATGVMLSSFKSGGDAKEYISYSALPKYVTYIFEGPMSAQYNSIGSCSYGTFRIIPNLDQMVEYAAGGDFENSFNALAKFIKAYNGYRLTMLTGDIPYSQAGKGKEGLFTPKYDTQQEVLSMVLEDFRASEEYFARAINFNGDVMYGGQVDKWRKLSNVMQLKVLMSMSKKITQEQKNRFAAIVSAGNLFTDNSDNLQLVYTTTSGTWHRLYNETRFVPYTSPSVVVVDELKRLNDRRLFYFAEPAPNKLSGGFTESDFDAYVGSEPEKEWGQLNTNFQAGDYSVVNLRYISEQAGDPYILLSYPEQCFIIAEAIERGWMAGVSKDYYEKGVKAALQMVASFDPANVYCHGMPITESYIEGYFTGDAAYASTTEERLKQIWYQRYFLKFLQDGTDAYLDFRRTGYPEFPLDPTTSLNTNNEDKFPMRWRYPSGEVQTNKENYLEALNRQFDKEYDGINELMWVLK